MYLGLVKETMDMVIDTTMTWRHSLQHRACVRVLSDILGGRDMWSRLHQSFCWLDWLTPSRNTRHHIHT